jgi:hypothetical protein
MTSLFGLGTEWRLQISLLLNLDQARDAKTDGAGDSYNFTVHEEHYEVKLH